MQWQLIQKHSQDRVSSNLRNYDEYAKKFSWAEARAQLDGLPRSGLNIAYEAIDRHLARGRGASLALRWIGRDNQKRDYTYAALSGAVNRFANVLAAREIVKGDKVF